MRDEFSRRLEQICKRLNRRAALAHATMPASSPDASLTFLRIAVNEVVHKDGDLAVNAVNVMSAHDNAIAKFEESNNRMGALEQQVQALQRAYDDIQNGVGNPAMVRAQIRGIAEQLLRMTGQEYGV